MAKADSRTCKCTCLTKDWARITVSIIAVLVVSMVVHNIDAMLTMGYYMDPAYFQVWSPIMMPAAGPPGMEFYAYSIIFTLIASIFFVMAYFMMGYTLPGKTLWNRGLLYGLLIFLVGGLPGMLSMVLLINLPIDLVAMWAVESLIIYLISGALVAKLLR